MIMQLWRKVFEVCPLCRKHVSSDLYGNISTYTIHYLALINETYARYNTSRLDIAGW
jgi:hypothetical protein